MQKNEKILKAVMNGEYNDVLISYYGEDKLFDNKMRYEEALTVFGQIYDGLNVVYKISRSETDENSRPVEDVVIESIVISTVE